MIWLRLVIVAALGLSLAHSFDWMNFGKTPSLLFVRRFAKTHETKNVPQRLPNVIEVTEVVDKLKRTSDQTNPSSFTIISRVRSADSSPDAETTGRKADGLLPTTRRLDSNVQVRSPQGIFSLLNGMVRFFGNKSSTPSEDAITATEKPEAIEEEQMSEARAINKEVLTPGRRKAGFFSLQNGRIQYHNQLPSRVATTSKPSSYYPEAKTSTVEEKQSYTFLPTPVWNIRNRTVNVKPLTGNDIEENQRKKAAQRLPTVRVDNETVFVPSESFLNGTILYNKLSIEDFLREHEMNATFIENLQDPQPTLPSNIPLSQMEVLYPGFEDIVKQKPSQIIIQNIFITHGQDPTANPAVISTSQHSVTVAQDQSDLDIVNTAWTAPSSTFSTSSEASSTEAEQYEAEATPYSNTTQEQQLAAPFFDVTEAVSSYSDDSSTAEVESASETLAHSSYYDREQTTTSTTFPWNLDDLNQVDDVVEQLLNNPNYPPSTGIVPETEPSSELPPDTENTPTDVSDILVSRPVLNSTDDSYKVSLYPPTPEEVISPEQVSDEIPKPITGSSSKPAAGPLALIVTESSPETGPSAIYVILTNKTLGDGGDKDGNNDGVTTVITVPLRPSVEPEEDPFLQENTTDPSTNASISDGSLTLQEEVETGHETDLNEANEEVVPGLDFNQVEMGQTDSTAQEELVPYTQEEEQYSETEGTEVQENLPPLQEFQQFESTEVPLYPESLSLPESTSENIRESTETTSTTSAQTDDSELSQVSVVIPSKKPAGGKTPGADTSIAALILAHTAALMAGKPSPFANKLSSMASKAPVTQKTSTSTFPYTSTIATELSTSALKTSDSYLKQSTELPTRSTTNESFLHPELTTVESIANNQTEDAFPQTVAELEEQVLIPVADNAEEPTSEQLLPYENEDLDLVLTSETSMNAEDSIERFSDLTTQSQLSTTQQAETLPQHQELHEQQSLPETTYVTEHTTAATSSEVYSDLDKDSTTEQTVPGTQNHNNQESQDQTPLEDAKNHADEVTESIIETIEPAVTASNDSIQSSTTEENVLPPATTASTEAAAEDSTTEAVTSIYSSCGASSTAMQLNFVNPSFPRPDVSKGHCTLKVNVESPHVCQIRVDFNDSRMLLPRQGFCLDQYLSVTGSVLIPGVDKFCGRNPNQHFYLDLIEPVNGKPRVINFDVTTLAEGYLYRYDIVIRQIECDRPSVFQAPRGCFQYYNEPAGLIKSYNYEGGQYYNNQNYRICIRAIPNACALALAAPEGAFGIHKISSKKVPNNRAGVGSNVCRRDYLWIPGGSKDGQHSSKTEDRYCGAKLSSVHGDIRPRPVIARMQSNVFTMEFRSGTPRKFNAFSHGPGFRISYTQLTHCPYNENNSSSLRTTTSKSTDDSFSLGDDDVFLDSDEQPSSRPGNTSSNHENFSEDYYDDEPPEASTLHQDSHKNASLTNHLNDILKASLWFSKLAQNFTLG